MDSVNHNSREETDGIHWENHRMVQKVSELSCHGKELLEYKRILLIPGITILPEIAGHHGTINHVASYLQER